MFLIYESHYLNLGQNIAFYRKRRHLTQEALAEKVNVNNTHLSRIENGISSASLDLIFAIADALDVEPYKLFQNKE